MATLHPEPVPGIAMIEPERGPFPGEVLIGYEVVDGNPSKKLFTKPHPKRMNRAGWIGVLISALVFWPAACVPCCLGCSYSVCQRPVYGLPSVPKPGVV